MKQIGAFHHLGLACRSLEAEYEGLAALGYVAEQEPVADPLQKVCVQFFCGPGPRIELVTPLAPQSPVSGWLKRGAKLYHLAYEVPDLTTAIAGLEDEGYGQVSEPVPAVAFQMRRISFLMSPTQFLVELIEASATCPDEAPPS